MTFLTAGLSPLWAFQSGGVMYCADTSEINSKAINISIKTICSCCISTNNPSLCATCGGWGKCAAVMLVAMNTQFQLNRDQRGGAMVSLNWITQKKNLCFCHNVVSGIQCFHFDPPCYGVSFCTLPRAQPGNKQRRFLRSTDETH